MDKIMKSYGKLYGDLIKYPHTNFFPILEPGWTKETEEPFRDGKCLVFRLPWTRKGYVVGIWGKPSGKSETQALIEAIEARVIDLDVIRDLHDSVWAPEDDDDVSEQK